MFKIAKSTWIGLIIGIMFIVTAIVETGSFMNFVNVPSFLITVGGTFAAVIVSFPPNRLKTLWPVMVKAFKNDRLDVKEDIDTIVSLSEISRRDGILALEDVINDYTDDEFLRRGITLIIDGADEEQLRTSLEGETYFMQQRHQKGYAMLDMIASTAPALGLLGTYVGLIPMLNNLDDPAKLGPMMALELVSSFYGAFLAYIIFSPLAKRLKIMSAEEMTRREILIEGLAYLQQGKNPKLIIGELGSYVNAGKTRSLPNKGEEEFVSGEVAN